MLTETRTPAVSHPGLSRQVIDDIARLQYTELAQLCQVGGRQPKVSVSKNLRDVLTLDDRGVVGGERIDSQNLIPSGEKRLGQMRSDEPRGPGDH